MVMRCSIWRGDQPVFSAQIRIQPEILRLVEHQHDFRAAQYLLDAVANLGGFVGRAVRHAEGFGHCLIERAFVVRRKHFDVAGEAALRLAEDPCRLALAQPGFTDDERRFRRVAREGQSVPNDGGNGDSGKLRFRAIAAILSTKLDGAQPTRVRFADITVETRIEGPRRQVFRKTRDFPRCLGSVVLRDILLGEGPTVPRSRPVFD